MLERLTKMENCRSFSVSPENLTGEKGNGGKATERTSAEQARELGQGWKVNPCMNVPAGQKLVMADVQGQGAIKHIWITCAEVGRTMILRIWFDGHKNPAVEAPLSDFFCNAYAMEFRQVSSLAICVNPSKGYNCYFEMPYFKGFRMEIENLNDNDMDVFYQIDCEEKVLDPQSLYFHAQFRRMNPVPYKEPYVILDNIKGRGKYVGTYMHWRVKSNGWWGEGEGVFTKPNAAGSVSCFASDSGLDVGCNAQGALIIGFVSGGMNNGGVGGDAGYGEIT